MSSYREDGTSLLRSAQWEGKMQQTQVCIWEIPIESKEKILHSEGHERSDQPAQGKCGISVLGAVWALTGFDS